MIRQEDRRTERKKETVRWCENKCLIVHCSLRIKCSLLIAHSSLLIHCSFIAHWLSVYVFVNHLSFVSPSSFFYLTFKCYYLFFFSFHLSSHHLTVIFCLCVCLSSFHLRHTDLSYYSWCCLSCCFLYSLSSNSLSCIAMASWIKSNSRSLPCSCHNPPSPTSCA